eukprot:TRINITY_DN15902_c0_g1_i3.p1 TRINITY_DN15902_c0_g1~~TRINITY_DN15902_c0_g1_i3.p1  ORF type:complete len:100 (+),score=3.94 TRINITY_DN15902_c0_g1_i3:471-770(+)
MRILSALHHRSDTAPLITYSPLQSSNKHAENDSVRLIKQAKSFPGNVSGKIPLRTSVKKMSVRCCLKQRHVVADRTRNIRFCECQKRRRYEREDPHDSS